MKRGFAAPIFFDVIKNVLNFDLDDSIHIDFAGRTDYGIISHILKSVNADPALYNEYYEKIYLEIHKEFKEKLDDDSLYVLDGVRNLLKLLAANDSFILGIVTGNFRKNALLKLENCGLDSYFKCGAYGDFSLNRKKLPLIAMEQSTQLCGFTPDSQKTLVIGDTHRDIESATYNNMKSMGVATGTYSYEELVKYNPDLIFENFSDYLSVYSSINKLFNI